MLKGFIDRIEGNFAVILSDDDEITLPANALPDDVGEGDWVKIFIEKDQEETERQQNEIGNIQDRLRNNT